MKGAILLLLVGVVTAKYMTNEVKYADKDFMVKQKAIFEIFANIWQPKVHNSYYEEAKNFDYLTIKDKITNEHAFECFNECWEKGFIDMEDIFSPLTKEHNHQMLSVFKMMYYAKDWDTFYKFMVWARFHINPGMFIQAVTMAVLHRDDFAGLVLPAIYEINPFYYFSSYTITKARRVQMMGHEGMQKDGNVFTFTVPMNYTNYYINTNPESKLAYFMEDIGLNSYFYYWSMDYYKNLGGEEFGLHKDRRGEFYMYQIRQLLARYYLERLSVGLGEIPELDYWTQITMGYYPSLMFFNGVNFPTRTNNYMMHLNGDNARWAEHLYGIERRVFDAIDAGFFLKPNGEKIPLDKPETIEYLGNIIQNNKDTLGNMYFYGMLETYGRKLFSGSFDSVDSFYRVPGVLELFETAMRDPMFYSFYKRISFFYDAFITKMPKYKKTDLIFDGVKFESVEMDKLLTYFDMFTADITNAVDVPLDTKDFKSTVEFKAQVPRMNHVPFNVHMKLTSNKAQKAVVTMFVGPKYDSHGKFIEFNKNRNNFWELDRWMVELKEGDNVFDRKSTDFTWFVKDRTTYFELYKQLMTSMNGGEKFPLDMSEAHCGFPSRLMLPRGRVGGLPVQFFFMVYPYHAPAVERFNGYDESISCGVGSGARFLDSMPFGYPFNREFEYHFMPTQNMFVYDTLVYHKANDDIMVTY